MKSGENEMRQGKTWFTRAASNVVWSGDEANGGILREVIRIQGLMHHDVFLAPWTMEHPIEE